VLFAVSTDRSVIHDHLPVGVLHRHGVNPAADAIATFQHQHGQRVMHAVAA